MNDEKATTPPAGTVTVTVSAAAPQADAPAIAAGTLYQSLAHSTGIAFQNAVAVQQQNTLAQAATVQGVMQIYSLDTAAAAGATEKVAQTGVADNLTSLLTVLKAFDAPGGHAGASDVTVPAAPPGDAGKRDE